VSRVGNKPVQIAAGVKVAIKDHVIRVSGPKGELTADVHPDVTVEVRESEVVVTRPSDKKEHRSLHGLWRALVANMIKGVQAPYVSKLELVGVGYKVEMKGKGLQVSVGYSHPILFVPPDGITIEAPTPTNVVINGIDKQLVGQVAAKIRSFRPPEPYKGKGIKYEGEYIRRKAGKAAAAAGAK
jgi:large subunit ribosomal protein L6